MICSAKFTEILRMKCETFNTFRECFGFYYENI